jgi:hypothetical protein
MSFRRYVTVDGTAGPEQNLARLGTLGAGVADRFESLPQLERRPPPPIHPVVRLGGDEGPLPLPFLELINRSHFGELTMIRQVTIAFIALGCSTAASADDISLQIGGRFSIYAPLSCHKLDQSHFSLVLDCNFQGRRSRFYLKEFPGQVNEAFDPREFPPSQYNVQAYLNTALRAVVDELDPGMIPRLKFPNWGSNASDDADALFWEEGYLIEDQAGDSEKNRRCAFVRIQSYRRGLSAVLFALSDGDRPSLENRSSNCGGVPGEVTTILGSLGELFEGGRFIWARPKQ